MRSYVLVSGAEGVLGKEGGGADALVVLVVGFGRTDCRETEEEGGGGGE